MAGTKIVTLGYNATTNTFIPISVSNAGFINVHVTNSIPLTVATPATAVATETNVAASAASVQLLAANAVRLGFIIVNDSTSVARLKFGATASATSFTYLLQPGDTVESMQYLIYRGRIDAIWVAANGSARITEL